MGRVAFCKRRGVTLVELAIVILVISILIAISLSFFRGLFHFARGGSATRDLAAALQVARNIAVKSNETIYFEIDLDKEGYRAYRLERSGEEAIPELVIRESSLPADLSLLRVTSAAGRSLEKGKVLLHFLPSGVGEEMALYLGREGGDVEATIIFNRYKGKASIHNGELLHNLENPQWEEAEEEE